MQERRLDHLNTVHGRADMQTAIDDRIREGIVIRYLQMVADRSDQTGRSPLEVIAADATAAIITAGGAIGGITSSDLTLLDTVTLVTRPTVHTAPERVLPPPSRFPLPRPFENIVYNDTNREIDSPRLEEPITVTPIESGILALTLSQPGRVFSYRLIAEECTRRSGHKERRKLGKFEPYEVDPTRLRTHVNHVGNKLRQALTLETDYTKELQIFVAKVGFGYMAFPSLARANRAGQ